jgi:hypothetical protein
LFFVAGLIATEKRLEAAEAENPCGAKSWDDLALEEDSECI